MQDTAAFGSRFRPSDLRDAQKKIHELAEQIEAAEYVLTRIQIRSPEAGVVTDLKFHTPGAAAVTAFGVRRHLAQQRLQPGRRVGDWSPAQCRTPNCPLLPLRWLSRPSHRRKQLKHFSLLRDIGVKHVIPILVGSRRQSRRRPD